MCKGDDHVLAICGMEEGQEHDDRSGQRIRIQRVAKQKLRLLFYRLLKTGRVKRSYGGKHDTQHLKKVKIIVLHGCWIQIACCVGMCCGMWCCEL